MQGMHPDVARSFMRPLSVIGIRPEVIARFGDIEGAFTELLNLVAAQQDGIALSEQTERDPVETNCCTSDEFAHK
jgi:hypothetical protein